MSIGLIYTPDKRRATILPDPTSSLKRVLFLPASGLAGIVLGKDSTTLYYDSSQKPPQSRLLKDRLPG